MRRHGGQVLAERLLHIGMEHADIVAKAVALGVFLAQYGIARGDLDAGEMDRGISRHDAKGRNAGADSRLVDGFARGAGNGGGQEHRIDSGAKALLRLEDVQTAIEEPVLGQ